MNTPRPIFLGLRLFNEPKISDSGPPAQSPSRRTWAQDFYVLKKNPSTSAGFDPANLGSPSEDVTLKPQLIIIFIIIIIIIIINIKGNVKHCLVNR